jgi:hypothetical protein
MTNELKTVQFHGATLYTTMLNGLAYVAIRPICEALGLGWSAQLKRIKRHAVLSTCVAIMTTQVPGDTQSRESVFLQIDMLNGWLVGIDAKRVRPELREKVRQYQFECFRVLNSHFRGPPPPPPPQKRIPYEPLAIGMRPRPLNRADQRIVNLHAQRLANQAFYLVREHIRLRFEDEMRQFGYACIEEIVDDTDLSEAVNN